MEETNRLQKLGNFYNKNYKKFLFISLILIFICLIYMFVFYQTNHDYIHKDISLTGGTSVTIPGKISGNQIERDLSEKLADLETREISDLLTQEQKAIMIETTTDSNKTQQILEDYLGYKLTPENSSFEFTGSTLSEKFYRQLILAVVVAFIFMSIVIFIMFRTFIPSSAVVLSAFADMLMTIVAVNIFGMKISSAGIIAFLMLIGYSVDTDILLTNRVLKREGSVNKKIFGAFKTGMTMTLAAMAAVAVALIFVRSSSDTLTQIFTILLIGLVFDIFNTWVTNASLIKWYAENKK